MLLSISFFLLLLTQISALNTIPKCSQITFGTCPTNMYCGIKTATEYDCLVCPLDSYCDGSGLAYPLSKNTVNRHPSYIVSKQRSSIHEKPKKIITVFHQEMLLQKKVRNWNAPRRGGRG
jgi:hypothetical protein